MEAADGRIATVRSVVEPSRDLSEASLPQMADVNVASSGPPLLPWMRWLLRFAGCYNLLVGLGLLLLVHESFKLLGLEKPQPVMYVQLVGLLVGLFGVGYLLVAAQPLENRTLLWLGLSSKALGCGLSFYHVARGSLPPVYVPIVVFSDLIYLPFFFVIARRLDRFSKRAAPGD
jgi:small multidrug resistance pump